MSELVFLQLPYVFVPKFGVAFNKIGHHQLAFIEVQVYDLNAVGLHESSRARECVGLANYYLWNPKLNGCPSAKVARNQGGIERCCRLVSDSPCTT